MDQGGEKIFKKKRFVEKCMKKLNELAEDNFRKWNNSLKTKKSREVADQYLEEGELFGTVSAKIRHGRKEIKGYFDHFLQIDPSGKVIERETMAIDENTFLDGGLYDFEVTKNGKRQIIEARFTYIWQKDNRGSWKVKHHHSATKTPENEKLNKQSEVLDLSGNNIEWGINEELGNNMTLRTGFLNKGDGSAWRFTRLIKRSDDGVEEIVYRQISERPEDKGA